MPSQGWSARPRAAVPAGVHAPPGQDERLKEFSFKNSGQVGGVPSAGVHAPSGPRQSGRKLLVKGALKS